MRSGAGCFAQDAAQPAAGRLKGWGRGNKEIECDRVPDMFDKTESFTVL